MRNEEIHEYFKETVFSDWERPINFENYQLPKFDINVFPTWLKEFIEAVAEETQTPIDAAAMNSFATLSTAVAKKYNVKANEGSWIETLNTYTVIALESSERKTPVYKLFLKPIADYQSELRNKLIPRIIEENAKRNALAKKNRTLRKTVQQGRR